MRLLPIQITPPTVRWLDALKAAAAHEGLRPAQWIFKTLTQAMVDGGFFKERAIGKAKTANQPSE